MSPMENRTKSPGENLSVGGTTLQLAGGLISQEPQGENRCNGNDAVCFTAGFAGSMFGAGTIHAYLAADRKPPALVAGISMGAVNAVAMQRCYQELENVKNGSKAEREVARWTWFREYLTSLYEVCCADRKHREGAAKHVHSTPWYKNAMVRVGSLLSRVHPGVPKTK